jgi:2-dehydropantoate 2-reductase
MGLLKMIVYLLLSPYKLIHLHLGNEKTFMNRPRMAVIGVGATGSVLSAALLVNSPESILVDPSPGLGEALLKDGIKITGAISYPSVPVKFYHDRISDLKKTVPDVIFICTKTFHLPQVLKDLNDVVQKETKIISTHNGLGPENLIADQFGAHSVFRMSLNYGVSVKGPGIVESAFFNPPNHLGSLVPENRELGQHIAKLLTGSGLNTEFVDDIKLFVWKKMVIKCTMSSICAVTNKTIKDALQFPPTREIAEYCFNEILAVARAKGYDIDEADFEGALSYLEKVGDHKDSMCFDMANKSRTEIDFLGGKVVEYGRDLGIPTSYFSTLTNLVRALEDKYLKPQ